jgi:hypothetical protein
VSRSLQRRVEKAVPALPPPAPSAPAPAADDSAELAREIGAAFGRLVRHFVRQYGMTPDEARARASPTTESRPDWASSCPAEELTWGDLGAIANVDPDKALGRWQEVQQAAREELRNGHRAARVLEAATSDCWERAGFLALRAELLQTLGCPSPLERQLVDQLALWQTLLMRWQETVALYTSLAHDRAHRTLRQDDPFEGPHAPEAEALERAERMVERLHRLYLQTLDALRSLRRSPRVVVRQARHVNVAQQQVNLDCGPVPNVYVPR